MSLLAKYCKFPEPGKDFRLWAQNILDAEPLTAQYQYPLATALVFNRPIHITQRQKH